ncbi:NAD(P)-binding domain [Phytophthora cactorum]|nr:NAD(P)-binding domain [Phytophthora cactorum]
MLTATAKRMRQSTMHTLKAYDKSEHRVLVIGGNGFVGSNILQRAVQKGIEVCSLNPTGKPQWQDVPGSTRWTGAGRRVRRQAAGQGRRGGHGRHLDCGCVRQQQFMEKMCGDATIVAARAAQKAGAERFVFVSNSRVGSYYPSWLPMYGYYHGKQRAETAMSRGKAEKRYTICILFPNTGVALRPGFIYGWRRTKKGRGIPLQLAGAPISMLARTLEMRAAIPVGAVAKAAVLSAIGPVHGPTLDTTSMLELAASFHIHEE